MTYALKRFEGYGVLITGAARGIGAATARRLAAEGARVLITDIDVEAAEKTAEDVPGADFTGCDVSDRAQVEAAAAYAAERFGTLDVLVNNAFSCAKDAPRIEDEPDGTWQRDLDICLTGAFRCARAAMPYLESSGRGAIVNIGSVNAEVGLDGHSYSAAKAGLASFTRTLAGDAGPRGVRVNQINPGTIRTRGWTGQDRGLADLGRKLYPLGRVGEPEDVAAAVAFLASRDASWITGTTLRVDGGLLAVNNAFGLVLAEAKAGQEE
ncbi:SDR family NAD(P)-dependent oxidoreductase [Streptomyces katsurahamanus]|uniref:SDR family oxidoreductase n=1 Tax=Streptomyces katsurahamanus TaxID=2577098 RepID=A0ABW9NSQ9_9ACTN|nr:SDR family NAD(P)-dependent oxidoreductase [Streptomyces katsurahamanus]MQS36283.1 SDR family oxidoreductase [Streptomyces katsurahamanus]